MTQSFTAVGKLREHRPHSERDEEHTEHFKFERNFCPYTLSQNPKQTSDLAEVGDILYLVKSLRVLCEEKLGTGVAGRK